MKRILLTIFVIITAASSTNAQEIFLSLDECIRLSETNDPYIQNTKLDILAARAQKNEVLAEYFPRLSLGFNGFMSEKYFVDLFVDPTIGETIREEFDEGYLRSGYAASLRLIQPLYAGGRIITGNKLAKVGVKAAELKHEVNLRDKKEEVEKAYWEIVSLEEKRKTLTHLEALLNTLEKDVTSGIAAGVITEAERLLLNTKKNELKSGKIHLEGGIKLLKMNLFNAIGQKYTFIKAVSDSLNPHIDDIVLTDRLNTLLPPDNYYVSEEKMAAEVTETELLELLVESKKLEKKLALGEYLPQIGVGLNYGYSRLTQDNLNAIALASVKVPISDWGKGSQKLKRLDYQIQKAQNEKEYLSSQLILQARQLWLNLNIAWEQMKVAEENVIYVEKTVYNQISQYEAGLIPLSDMLMTQTELFEATENLVKKQIEYSNALTAYNGRMKN